jgi:hypothetical protein
LEVVSLSLIPHTFVNFQIQKVTTYLINKYAAQNSDLAPNYNRFVVLKLHNIIFMEKKLHHLNGT